MLIYLGSFTDGNNIIQYIVVILCKKSSLFRFAHMAKWLTSYGRCASSAAAISFSGQIWGDGFVRVDIRDHKSVFVMVTQNLFWLKYAIIPVDVHAPQ